jgi:hypothetical protein
MQNGGNVLPKTKGGLLVGGRAVNQVYPDRGRRIVATAFISHASQDREVAERICSFLEGRGIRCWIAPRDVRPGRRYGEEIVDGIHGADAVVLVLSENANNSTFVEREIERAVSYGKPTLPVRVREVQPSRSLELFISNAHWIDAWKPPMEQYLDRLADSIRSLSPDGAGTTGTKWTDSGVNLTKVAASTRTFGKSVAIGAAVLVVIGLGATTAWWLLGRQRSIPSAPAIAIVTPTPMIAKPLEQKPALAPVPAIEETKPAAPPQAPAQERSSPPPVEPKQTSSEPALTESRPPSTPTAGVSDVLATIGNATGHARDEAIVKNLQRLPQQITADDLIAVTNGAWDRNNAIKLIVNRLPNPIKIEEALRILGNANSRQRSDLIGILSSRLPQALTVKELLALTEGAYGRSDVIHQFVKRLPNPLSVEETLQILDNTASRERFGLIEMLNSRMPQKLTVKDLLAVIEGTYDRSGAIRQLVIRLPSPLSLDELLQILDNTASRDRFGLIEMLNSRMPQKLTVKDLFTVIEGTYDRNGTIKSLVNRLPNPIQFDDLQSILGSTSSRERFNLIQILAPRTPTGLSPEQISTLVQGSYNPQEAEKLLKH